LARVLEEKDTLKCTVLFNREEEVEIKLLKNWTKKSKNLGRST
jgi:hypothetical protein